MQKRPQHIAVSHLEFKGICLLQLYITPSGFWLRQCAPQSLKFYYARRGYTIHSSIWFR